MTSIAGWEKKFAEHLQRKIHSSKSPSSVHFLDHSRRIFIRSKSLCKALGGDIEVMVAAAYLHDLARHEGLVVHGERSARLAKPILEAEGFPKEKIPKVLEAISLHDYQTPASKRRSIESRILYDADKMDAFGALGVKRYVMFFFAEKRETVSINDIIEKNLKVKWKDLHFKESRRLAREDFEYAINFFKRLKEEEGA